MARTGRIFVPNALNHIVIAGVAEEVVFLDEEDYHLYLGLLHKYKIRFECKIFTYCLMNTHPHLLLESPQGEKNMSSFAHGLSLSYAMAFNNKYKRKGHLWQNRYKNYIVAKDDYLFNVISYIEYNPVRAGIVKRPEDYPWSGYRGRVLGKKDPILDPIEFGDRSEAKPGTGLKQRLETSLFIK